MALDELREPRFRIVREGPRGAAEITADLITTTLRQRAVEVGDVIPHGVNGELRRLQRLGELATHLPSEVLGPGYAGGREKRSQVTPMNGEVFRSLAQVNSCHTRGARVEPIFLTGNALADSGEEEAM